jgi:IS5 family transposase
MKITTVKKPSKVRNGFADLMTTRSKKASKLDRIHKLVNWNRFDYRLKKLLNRSGLGPIGYQPLTLFKALVLQHLYGLSDPEMEEMLYDRISFRAFCDLGLSDAIPDETTLCRFRNALGGKTQTLFKLVLQDIEQAGLKPQSGTIVDATVIQSACATPPGGEVNDKDPQAGWTKKGGQYTYGYKAHLASDVETSLVTAVDVTGAEVHDTNVLESLLDSETSEVYADKAYASKDRDERLDKAGIANKIMYKAKGKKKHPTWQTQLNKIWSKTRCGIEKIFGYWKQSMNLRRCRYRGEDKVRSHIHLVAMVYNLFRASNILHQRS